MITIILPIYNEEKYIENCILSLLKQDYPLEDMEWIFVDGKSTDKTKCIIENYMLKKPNLIRMYDNPNKTVSYAMNIGINVSKGKYIIRLDSHAEYAQNYISKCVFYLDNTNALNVGGLAETKGKNFVGNVISLMLSSKFGVGNSHFRTNAKSGYVDTVPFGAFSRSVFEKYGNYDERLTRNQDNELNYRIRKYGGRIYLADDIKFIYFCRDSIKEIINMAVMNGKWTMLTNKLCPGVMGIRHFIPFIFVVSLIIMPILIMILPSLIWVYLIELSLYLLLDLIFSFIATNKISELLLLIYLFPTFHIFYGLGSLVGLFKKNI